MYMLCKVAQVFRARGGRPIYSFARITFLWEGKWLYADKVCAHTPVLWFVLLLVLVILVEVLVILVELPHLAYNSTAFFFFLNATMYREAGARHGVPGMSAFSTPHCQMQ